MTTARSIHRDPNGLGARYKFLWQRFGLCAAGFLYATAGSPTETQLILPFVKTVAIDLGWFFIVLCWFFIVGMSNAVNLTDGLDGLAILPTVMVAGALGIFAYVAGNVKIGRSRRALCGRRRGVEHLLWGHHRRGPGVPVG